MKITDVKCFEGKSHFWKEIYTLREAWNNQKFSWCKKCGSITEFSDVKSNFKRCLSDDQKTYYIEIPKCHTEKK